MRLTSKVLPAAVVHGPYLDKRLDRMIVNIQVGTKRRNMTYARYLMMEHLGRLLDPVTEHVDHKNDNRFDDRIENLQILTPADNTWKQQGRITWYVFTCPECNGQGIQDLRFVRGNRKKGRKGPFCGRSCAGRYSQRAQVAQR